MLSPQQSRQIQRSSTLGHKSLKAPWEAWFLGGLGVLPYVGTSIAAVYASDQADHANKLLSTLSSLSSTVNTQIEISSALDLLNTLVNLQISYGACILSFLGAFHWGFELAAFNGSHGLKRYILGILPMTIAFPTLLLPSHLALYLQWVGFAGTWWGDVKAGEWGWVPQWYPTYRFYLSLVVGSSMLLTLGAQGYWHI